MRASEILYDRDQLLIDYLSGNDDSFDPRSHWRDFAEWAAHYNDGGGEIVAMLEKLSGQQISAEDFEDEEAAMLQLNPLIYNNLPQQIRTEFEAQANQGGGINTRFAFSLLSKNKLPPNTTLVHFTDNPQEIVRNGFRIGIPDMHLLGETVRLPAWMKNQPGYNFAYPMNGKYGLQNGGWKKKYAVIFCHTGVHVMHYGDDEEQVIFWGPYVSPNSIIEVKDADEL